MVSRTHIAKIAMVSKFTALSSAQPAAGVHVSNRNNVEHYRDPNEYDVVHVCSCPGSHCGFNRECTRYGLACCGTTLRGATGPMTAARWTSRGENFASCNSRRRAH